MGAGGDRAGTPSAPESARARPPLRTSRSPATRPGYPSVRCASGSVSCAREWRPCASGCGLRRRRARRSGAGPARRSWPRAVPDAGHCAARCKVRDRCTPPGRWPIPNRRHAPLPRARVGRQLGAVCGPGTGRGGAAGHASRRLAGLLVGWPAVTPTPPGAAVRRGADGRKPWGNAAAGEYPQGVWCCRRRGPSQHERTPGGGRHDTTPRTTCTGDHSARRPTAMPAHADALRPSTSLWPRSHAGPRARLAAAPGSWRTAVRGRRRDCLTGCAIGEVLRHGPRHGLRPAQRCDRWSCPVALAFVVRLRVSPCAASCGRGCPSGRPSRSRWPPTRVSILVMELIDNTVQGHRPRRDSDAGLDSAAVLGSLAGSLALAFAVTVPVNLLDDLPGRGHAVVHAHHGALNSRCRRLPRPVSGVRRTRPRPASPGRSRSSQPRSSAKRSGVPGRACATAARSAARHHADHGVAAGGGMVGEEDHRPAVRPAPGPRPAPCPRWAVRRPRRGAAAGPRCAAPIRLLAAADRVRAARPAGDRGRPNQSSRGPGRRRSTSSRRGGGQRTTVGAGRGAAARRPAGRSPARSGGGPRPESRSADRLPSTGGTAMPPATAR